jgi:pimeloyl-ACP methyl ester carboxylesterase
MKLQLCVALLLLHLPVRAAAAEGIFQGLFYETRGRGETVVLIHGGQLDRRMWDLQWNDLGDEWRLIRYDIRGFGKSEAPTQPYSDRADLESLLKHIGCNKATLVGLSLGAAIAVDFALEYPAMVDRLVLVCPGLGGFDFKDKANDLRAVVEAARDDGYEKAAELWLNNPYMSVAMEKPAVREKLRTIARENGACWLKNPLLQRPLRPSAATRLQEIQARTLIVGGGRDVSDIHRIIEQLSAEIPRAQKVIFPDAGHLVPLEQPERFNALLKEFLANR